MTISLTKRTESVGIVLAKRNIVQPPVVRVGLVCDVSGSAKPLFEKGRKTESVMQTTLDRLLAVSAKFDDNGEMDMWVFSSGFDRLETATASDYGTYIEKKLLNSGATLWNGTNYAPVLKDVVGFYFPQSGFTTAAKKVGGLFSSLFGKKPAAPAASPSAPASTLPALCLFITDGVNSDQAETERLLRLAQDQKYPVYFLMVGVGPAREFKFIEKMADDLSNVGFVNLSSLDISDEDLYERVLGDEFCEWVKGR